ncbi:MAG TPA: hypothetical protein VGD81_19905 [Opitutaceae bacterium]
MTLPTSIVELLRWRAAQAEAEAPPAPRAARLLRLGRPWWEVWPDRFRVAAARVTARHVAYGHAMTAPPGRGGHPVPAVIVRERDDLETCARVLFLSLRDDRLRLRFHLEDDVGDDAAMCDATFIAAESARVLFDARAIRSAENEYRVDAGIPASLADEWAPLRVTDRKPFRLILRAAKPLDGQSEISTRSPDLTSS